MPSPTCEMNMEAELVGLTHIIWQGKAGDSTSGGRGGGKGGGREGIWKGG